MSSPIALQLYSIREVMNQNFRSAVERVAKMGYVGVETAGFPGTTPKGAMNLFNELGLKVAGAHLPMPLGENQKDIIETIKDLGNPPLVIPYQPREKFESLEGLKKLSSQINEAYTVAKTNGFRLGYHNHDHEMHLIDGKPALLVLSEMVDPEVFFEVDTYWVKTGGVDPVHLVKQLGPRAPILHIKDGPCKRGVPMTAVGDGVMDFPPIIEASKQHTQWLIVEIDACATDMVEAVQKSYHHLTSKGLAHGNQ